MKSFSLQVYLYYIWELDIEMLNPNGECPDPSELIPIEERYTLTSTTRTLEKIGFILGWFPYLKWGILWFAVLGGLYVLTDRAVEELTILEKDHDRIYKEKTCPIHSSEEFPDEKLYVAQTKELKYNLQTIKHIKRDIIALKEEIIHLIELWKTVSTVEKSVKCELSNVDDKIKTAISESESVDDKIKNALNTYDADKLALFDYAAEYAGGEIIDLIDTAPYPTNKMMQFFGFFRVSYASSPQHVITPSCLPGECFAFYGNQGKIVIKLGKTILIKSVSMEHAIFAEDITNAPKDFEVFGLIDGDVERKVSLGKFTYSIVKRESVQTFKVSTPMFGNRKFEYVELDILSNHGHPHFTCIYRFRVHTIR